jgi:pimeloyl-ACP methyl ester carboxylesterase
MTTTHMLETAGAEIAYDVHGPLPTADGRPPLLMIAQPMDASGFATLASHFPDRTVVTYDPRGLGRSTRKDGRVDHSPTVQADDVHAVIEALGAGPVEMFASSGGAVTAFALVAAHPGDVITLVAHEPPLIPVLPDAEAAERARAGVRDAYETNGTSAGMAAFIAMTSWRGEFTDEYFSQPAPDPARFGMPTEDDGSHDDPLLSDRSWAVSSYRPDVDALAAAHDAHRDRRRGGIPGHLHRTHGGGHGRAARSAGDRVPEPPRRLPRRRVRIRRPTRGLRAQAARRPRRRRLRGRRRMRRSHRDAPTPKGVSAPR